MARKNSAKKLRTGREQAAVLANAGAHAQLRPGVHGERAIPNKKRLESRRACRDFRF